MSEDLNKKIKQITDILGQENIPDNFKGLLSMLASPPESEEPVSRPAEHIPVKEDKSQRSEMEENLEMVRRVKKVMEHMNSNNDPKVNLLNAIRPFMSNSRQKKVNSCIKLIQMASLSRLMDDSDKGNF